jgi:glycosyltransferase involved in cell wall biosynthesis
LLVGDGELRPDLERQVNELGIARRTVFTGARADIPALLKTMDVFLFPSHFEGLGLAVVEAQAAGLPIVTADTIPPEAIIIHNACSILSLNDPISHWVEAIQKSHVKLGANPLDLIAASPFDQRVCLERLLAIYRGES